MHPTVHARNTPGKLALIMAASGEGLTYRELDECSNQGAQLFRKLGLKSGDVVAIFLENDIRFLEICWAAQRAGLYYTCVSSRLTAGEVEYIVKDSGASALVAGHSLAKVAGEVAARLEDVKLLMVGGTIPGFQSYERETGAMPDTPIADETSGTDMLYSSGTTGRPKGVRVKLSGQAIDEVTPLVALCSGLFGLDANSIYLSPAPLYHAAPLRYSMAVQRLGGTAME